VYSEKRRDFDPLKQIFTRQLAPNAVVPPNELFTVTIIVTSGLSSITDALRVRTYGEWAGDRMVHILGSSER
jgi:hypothetical protein